MNDRDVTEVLDIIESLYRNYALNIQRMCYLYLGDAAAAEDAMQETFLKAYEKYPLFRGKSDIKTWLTRIAINTCKDILRRNARGKAFLRETLANATTHTVSVDFCGNTADRILLTDAIHSLPGELREVTILFYYEELSTKTIAAILHIPRTTVEFRLKKARLELKKVIKEDLFYES